MHPSRDEIAGLLLGTLIENEADRIAEHVEQCAACEQTARELETISDDMVRSLRRPAVPHPFEQESQCRRLVDVIEVIGREPSLAGTPVALSTASDELGTIRDYQLLAKLGQGGMGTVYKALHTQLEKVVALKVLPAERMKDQRAVDRFRREMKAVGRLAHPNIVGAHDAGEHEGTHYLVMEYVDGVDLSELVRRLGPLPVADACELVRQAAVGLQHAHEHGLVHRDIKPSNLMLTAEGRLKILDLGLARLHNGQHGELTSSGQMMGTVDYMAPEQTGDSHDVDIRADLYSLGATLYKLLSGHAPFSDPKYNTVVKKLKAMATEPIPSIQDHRPQVPSQLAAIIQRMLANEAEDRFATPAEVADAIAPFAQGADLTSLLIRYGEADESDVEALPADKPSWKGTEEHLSCSMTETDSGDKAKPVQADSPEAQPAEGLPAHDAGRGSPAPAPVPTEGLPAPGKPPVEEATQSPDRPKPPSPVAKPAPKPLRFKRRTVASAAIVGLAALFAAAMVIRLATDKGEILIKSFDLEIEVTIKRNNEVVDDFQVKQRPEATSYYSGEYEIEIKGGKPDAVEIKNGKFTLTRGKEVLVEIVRQEKPAEPSPPEPEQVARWELGPAEDVLPGIVPRPAKLPGIKRWQMETALPRTQVKCVAWSPDDRLIAIGTNGGQVRVYDSETLECLHVLCGHENTVNAVAWSPDGKVIASAGADRRVRLWDLDGELLTEIRQDEFLSHGVGTLTWSPDGDRFAVTAGADLFRVLIWHRDGTLDKHFQIPAQARALAWSPDGEWIATGSTDFTIRLWKPDGEPGPVLKGHENVVLGVAWSPDSQWIASCSADITVRVWKRDGTPGLVFQHEPGRAYNAVAWSPDGKRLASTDINTIYVATVDGQPESTVAVPVGSLYSVAWSHDGQRIAAAGSDGVALHAFDGKPELRLLCGMRHRWVSWSPQGDRLAASDRGNWQLGANGSVRLLTPDGCLVRELEAHGDVQWSPDGKRLAVGDHQSSPPINKVISLDGRETVKLGPAGPAVWSPDGERLASVCLQTRDPNVRFWNANGTPHSVLKQDGPPMSIAWHPDGEILAISGPDEVLQFIDPEGKVERTLPEVLACMGLSWSPDGKWLAGAGGPSYLVGRDGTRGPTLPGTHFFVSWSPDSQRFATGSYARDVYIWQLDGKPEPVLRGHTGWQVDVSWSSTGKHLASGAHDSTVICWNPDTGDPEWVDVALDKSKSVTLTAAGQILDGHLEEIEKGLVYIVENEDGRLETLKPSEFQKRIGQPLRYEPAQPAPASDDSNRRAAVWVLSVGGRLGVEMDGRRLDLKDPADLPEERFSVTDVYLVDCAQVADASLALLSPLTDLQGINLCGTSNVGDDGLQHLAQLPNLLGLNLQGTRITDDGLKQVSRITALEGLHLGGTSITTVGLASLLPLKNLKELYLGGTKVGDTELTCLARFQGLQKLELRSTAISDDGLVRLRALKKLESLDLLNAAVTADGVATLHEALPNSRIVWDGGTVEPRGVVVRRVAQWVLSKKGRLLVDEGVGEWHHVETLENLPQRPFTIRDVDFSGNDNLTDDDLAQLDPAVSVFNLWLGGASQITDRGLDHVVRLRSLVDLQLESTAITDAGVARLTALQNLKTLDLSKTLLTDGGMESLGKMKNLDALYLRGTDVTAK